MTTPSGPLLGQEVEAALAAGDPVVSLESTIFSELGLPAPSNAEALAKVLAAVTDGGAVPALTAVLDGVARAGVPQRVHDLICGPAQKVAARDLAPAMAQRWRYGATTVSASVTLSAAAGIRVFATGGIGGVHRGWEQTGDISADLPAIAKHQVITVTAGAKVFLDLPATLEYLETASVPVIGWQTDEFPAFHAPSSGLPLTIRADTADDVAAIADRHWSLGGGGIVVAVPVPAADGIPLDELNELISGALDAPETAAVRGPAVTPAILGSLGSLSAGRTVTANLALAENNAVVAAAIATAVAGRGR